MGCVRRSAHWGAQLFSALFTLSEAQASRGKEKDTHGDKTRIATHTLSSTLKCRCDLAVGLFQACSVFSHALPFNDAWLFCGRAAAKLISKGVAPNFFSSSIPQLLVPLTLLKCWILVFELRNKNRSVCTLECSCHTYTQGNMFLLV